MVCASVSTYVDVEITEDFGVFIDRVMRRLVARLLELQGRDSDDVLARIEMSKRLTRTLDTHVRLLVHHGVDRAEDLLLLQVENRDLPTRSHTWKDIGEALGVSAQAAQRKYGRTSGNRADQDGPHIH